MNAGEKNPVLLESLQVSNFMQFLLAVPDAPPGTAGVASYLFCLLFLFCFIILSSNVTPQLQAIRAG